MFVNAIEEVKKYTRPIHTITRNYNSNLVKPGAATLFFVNELGCAVTCKHVAELILKADSVHENFQNFKGAGSLHGSNRIILENLPNLENFIGLDSLTKSANFVVTNCLNVTSFKGFTSKVDSNFQVLGSIKITKIQKLEKWSACLYEKGCHLLMQS